MTSSFIATHTVAQALRHAQGLGVDRLDAQLLLCAALQQGRTWLIAHDDATLDASQHAQWLGWLQRRASGEPLAYILGDKEFFGLALAVSPDVLIPRPDTETLVEWALETLAAAFPEPDPDQAAMPASTPAAIASPIRDSTPAPGPTPAYSPARAQVLDLGTGSGAIALAIQHQRPDANVTAVDASEAALRMAQANATRLGLTLRFLHGDWLAPVQAERFHLIVSNPPYIAENDPHLAALGHEPRQALTSGPEGLDDLRHIIAAAPQHLHPGAWLLLEHGYDQAVAVAQLLAKQGFVNVSTRFDLGGQPRCTGASWPL